MLKGVLLDIDGTLIDSNHAHAQAWVAALAENGLDIPYETIRPQIGKGGDHLLEDTAQIDDTSGKGQRISKRRKQIFKEQHLSHLEVFPEVRALLEKMKSRGLKLVVASSASKDDLKALLDRIGIDDLIEGATSKDDVEHSKPDPDVIGAALKKLGVQPQEAVLLGDTPFDIEAARRAGMETVALKTGGWGEDGLRGAVEIYETPADLLRRFESSVFARETPAAQK